MGSFEKAPVGERSLPFYFDSLSLENSMPEEEKISEEIQKDEKLDIKEAQSPKFTTTHGMVPDIYVPAWKTNVPHREHLLELAELTDTVASTHCDSLYLNKRERIEKPMNLTLPERKFKYDNALHLSKYNATLRYRK